MSAMWNAKKELQLAKLMLERENAARDLSLKSTVSMRHCSRFEEQYELTLSLNLARGLTVELFDSLPKNGLSMQRLQEAVAEMAEDVLVVGLHALAGYHDLDPTNRQKCHWPDVDRSTTDTRTGASELAVAKAFDQESSLERLDRLGARLAAQRDRDLGSDASFVRNCSSFRVGHDA